MAFYRSRTKTCTDTRRRLITQLLAKDRHNVPELIAASGVKMTTVYGTVRHMVTEGWLKEERVPGTSRRDFVVTPAGRRGMEFILELADAAQADDSRASNPTAARSSS